MFCWPRKSTKPNRKFIFFLPLLHSKHHVGKAITRQLSQQYCDGYDDYDRFLKQLCWRPKLSLCKTQRKHIFRVSGKTWAGSKKILAVVSFADPKVVHDHNQTVRNNLSYDTAVTFQRRQTMKSLSTSITPRNLQLDSSFTSTYFRCYTRAWFHPNQVFYSIM